MSEWTSSAAALSKIDPNTMAQGGKQSVDTSSLASAGGGGFQGGILQAGFGVLQAIKNNKLRKQREKELEGLVNGMPEYTEDPTVQNYYAQIQSQQNAVNPAVAQAYRQAQINAANTAAMGQKVAGSGAEAINAAIAGQNAANSIAPTLANMQTQYAQNNLQNLGGAAQMMNRERQNVFGSQIAKNDAMQNLKTMQFGNAQKAWQDSWKNIIGGVNATDQASKDAMKAVMQMPI